MIIHFVECIILWSLLYLHILEPIYLEDNPGFVHFCEVIVIPCRHKNTLQCLDTETASIKIGQTKTAPGTNDLSTQ